MHKSRITIGLKVTIDKSTAVCKNSRSLTKTQDTLIISNVRLNNDNVKITRQVKKKM